MNSARAAILLCVLGLAQILGDVLGLDALRAAAAATTASPAPKVFSAVKGFETYSSRLFIEWADARGLDHSLELSAELYSRLRGPYNRRNAYGAVLAYGPVLASNPETKPLLDSVARYALCGDAPLLDELGIGVGDDPVMSSVAGPIRIRTMPLPGAPATDLPLIYEVPCSPLDSPAKTAGSSAAP